MKFDLAKLARENGRRGRATLQPIEERQGTVVGYRTTLRRYLRALARVTRDTVVPEFRRERGLTVDAPGPEWFRELREAKRQFEERTEQQMRELMKLEAERHTETFRERARQLIGIDTRAIIRSEDIEDQLRAALSRNAALINSLGDDVINRVQQTIYSASANGASFRDVSKQMQSHFEITRRRADLIARDQMSKLNSDLSRTRQEQAGVEKYTWRTSQDERVRPRHRRLDGTVYRWGESTGAEGGLPPGQPVQCRCVAIPIVEI